MKTLLTTLNAKYIHKSLSLRLLYVACKDYYDIDFVEYTIKDRIGDIVFYLLQQHADVIAFSVYIWNMEQIREICHQLKRKKPELTIILGGPEVSYDIDYFFDTFPIDYIISGEGEEVFPELLQKLQNKESIEIQGVSSKSNRDYRQTKPVNLQYIETLESPYVLPQDIKDMANRVLYFETSRGCPYACQYCLSSLEKGLRFFSKEYITKQLDMLLQSDVTIIKFLDRSFNAKVDHALFILEYLSANYKPGMQFQFEINADVLDQRIIDFFKNAPSTIFRLEIGIQSTYQPTNQSIKRYQDFHRLSSVIKQLQDINKVDLHLDLIAGLPLENKERFAKSFDDVFAFYPKELQLGFLKLLRGTGLRKQYKSYGYEFNKQTPYEILSSNDLSTQDIAEIRLVEHMLEKYWNSGKFPLTMQYLVSQVKSPFQLFLDIGRYYSKNQYKIIGYQMDELFLYLYNFATHNTIEITDVLIEDYLRMAKTKPKPWWPNVLTKTQWKQRMHALARQFQISPEIVFRYGVLARGITYDILAIYQDYQVEIYKTPVK